MSAAEGRSPRKVESTGESEKCSFYSGQPSLNYDRWGELKVLAQTQTL